MGDEFVTIDEAASIIGRTRATISRRLAAGELVAYIVGDNRRKRYVRRADVERLGQPTPVARIRSASPALNAA